MKYLNLVRYKNLIFIAFLQLLMHFCVASPLFKVFGIEHVVPAGALVLAVFGTVLVAAAGYVINDYFDTKIDALNRPEKVIVGESVPREVASKLYQGLMAAGIFCGMIVAFWAKSLSFGLIFVLVPGLLWFYSASYKRQFLVGNIIVSFCAALAVLLVAELETSFVMKEYGEFTRQVGVNYNIYVWFCGFAFFAYMFTFIREIVKDMEDEYGDRELESRTMPVVWGKKRTKMFVYAMVALTVVGLLAMAARIEFPGQKVFTFLSYRADMLTLRYVLCAVIAPLLVFVYMLARAKKVANYTQASKFLKIIMLLGTLYGIVFYFQLLCAYHISIFDFFITK